MSTARIARTSTIVALTAVSSLGCSVSHGSANHQAIAASSARRPAVRSALVAASREEVRRDVLGVPSLSAVEVEIVEPAPSSLTDARFEIVRPNGAIVPIEPVRDGAERDAPSAMHRTASFVVDYDREPLRSRCESAANERSADAILRRAERWISRKSLAIGFVTASVVFERREGDCSEHAVLAAALLRCNGIPARLASGYAVVRVGNVVVALGHMWTERFDDGWRVADAALPLREGEGVRLRFATFDGEGVDALDSERAEQLLDVARIRVRAR